MNARQRNRFINTGSFLALLAGLITGGLLAGSPNPNVTSVFLILEAIGKAWVDLLLVLVVPVIVAYLTYLVLSFGQRRQLGALAGKAILVHGTILLSTLAISAPLSYVLIRSFSQKLPGLRAFEAASEKIAKASVVGNDGIRELIGFLASFQGWIGTAILLLMFVTVIGTYAWMRLNPERTPNMTVTARTAAEIWLGRLQLMLLSLPLAVFALIVPLIAKSGFALLNMIGVYLLMICGVLIFCILLLYIAAGVWGNRSIIDFAGAIWPAQTIAFSSRASLASLPAMMDAAENRLGVPKTVTAVVVPFFASSFRLHRAVSPPFKFLFLNYVFNLELGFGMFLAFMFFQLATSFFSPGIPNGGDINLPIYIAFGIPLDAYLLLIAVNILPDMIMTVLNVTSVMTVTSITAAKSPSLDVASERAVNPVP